MKISDWRVAASVLLIGGVLTACGEDGFGSSTGAGSGDVVVSGNDNNVKICILDGDAQDDNEILTNDGCDDYWGQWTPATDPGTSQQSGPIPE